ncbi:hypothetical protein Dimus_027300 [Dionaea muscipula]
MALLLLPGRHRPSFWPEKKVLSYTRSRKQLNKGEEEDKDKDVERSGAFLESSGDDLCYILQHLCESGEELPQRALQVRSPIS